MKLGDRGFLVEQAQEFLIRTGFLISVQKGDKKVSPESYYGVKTKKAVIALQKSLDLEPTGIWAKSLYDIYAVKNEEKGEEETGDIDNKDKTEPKKKETNNTASSSNTPNFTSDSCPKGRWFDQDKEIDCYVLNRLTGTKIVFGISPEEVTESNSAQFDDADVRGRSSPFKQYSLSGPRSVSFTLTLYADYCPMGIVQTVNAIKALVYPKYGDVIESPHSYFKVGKFMSIDGVVTSVSVTWRKPFRDGYYLFADVSIDMDEVRSTAQSVAEVEKNG